MKKTLFVALFLLASSAFAGKFSDRLQAYENGEVNLTIGQLTRLMDAARTSNFTELDLDPIFTEEQQEEIRNMLEEEKSYWPKVIEEASQK